MPATIFPELARLQDENPRLKRAQLESRRDHDCARSSWKPKTSACASCSTVKERQKVNGQVTQILYAARDPFSRRVIVDKGQQDKISSGLPVVDDAGVVGQVTRVYPFVSEVTLITDKDQAVPVQIVRNGLRSVVFGLGNGQLELRFMPANADVQNGDLLVTSGLDGIFLPGFPVAEWCTSNATPPTRLPASTACRSPASRTLAKSWCSIRARRSPYRPSSEGRRSRDAKQRSRGQAGRRRVNPERRNRSMQPTSSSSRILLPVRPWFIVLSAVGRAAAELAADLGLAGMPDWVALVLIFWSIREPRKSAWASAFLLGLTMDVADASLMGQHALAYVLVAYAASALSRRILWFPLGQQALQILPAAAHSCQLGPVRRSRHAGCVLPGLSYFVGPLRRRPALGAADVHAAAAAVPAGRARRQPAHLKRLAHVFALPDAVSADSPRRHHHMFTHRTAISIASASASALPPARCCWPSPC